MISGESAREWYDNRMLDEGQAIVFVNESALETFIRTPGVSQFDVVLLWG